MNTVVGQILDSYQRSGGTLNTRALRRRYALGRDPVFDVLPLDLATDGGSQLRRAAVEHGEHNFQGFGGCHDASSSANLFATVHAKIVADKFGNMLRVKTLGEQVHDYMAGEGLNAPEMGRRVGRSRQNIENLLAGTVKNPSYLAQLARVMGTTADVLLSGRYVYRTDDKNTEAPPTAQSVTPDLYPWPLDPFITRERWAQMSAAERSAAAWEASKVLRHTAAAAAMPAPPAAGNVIEIGDQDHKGGLRKTAKQKTSSRALKVNRQGHQ